MSIQASNPVGWFEIHVADMERARSFYEGVFGHPLTAMSAPAEGMQMMSFAQGNFGYGASGALVSDPARGPNAGGTLIYFTCTDCAATQGRVLEHGGVVHRPAFSIGPHGYIAIVGDTEGNVIGVHALTSTGAPEGPHDTES